MRGSTETAAVFEDRPVTMQVKLAAAWVYLMLVLSVTLARPVEAWLVLLSRPWSG